MTDDEQVRAVTRAILGECSYHSCQREAQIRRGGGRMVRHPELKVSTSYKYYTCVDCRAVYTVEKVEVDPI